MSNLVYAYKIIQVVTCKFPFQKKSCKFIVLNRIFFSLNSFFLPVKQLVILKVKFEGFNFHEIKDLTITCNILYYM